MNRIIQSLALVATAFVGTSTAQAGSPLWTFTPLTATTITVASNGVALVEYLLTNQSHKTHTLTTTTTVPGVVQNTTAGHCSNPVTLAYLQSCTLSFDVTGSALQGNVSSGPKVCDQGNALQCYQPSLTDSLHITLATAPGATTLSISQSALTLNVSGLARKLTITNIGSAHSALGVTYTPSPALPSGTSITPLSCGTIPPLGTCELTITPGATATALEGLAPIPSSLAVSGTNTTNTVTSDIIVLTYGNIYQGGYVFAIDDSTPLTGSVGGKVAGLLNVGSFQWTDTGSTNIPGADSITDGKTNTDEIVGDVSCTSVPGSCAAYQCRIIFAGGGYTDWFLPAICEMGPDSGGPGCPANTPNMVDNLSFLRDFACVGVQCLSGTYWSSTEFLVAPSSHAWRQDFAPGVGSNQGTSIKTNIFGVRCSRALTI